MVQNQEKLDERLVIQTCTTKYVREEDRIALDSDFGNGQQARLWMTRRLTMSLVEALEKSGKNNPPTGGGGSDAKDHASKEAKQQAHKKPEGTHVEISGEENQGILIGTIKLKFVKEHAVLDFLGINDGAYRFVLEMPKLRQWLQQLEKIMSAAAWVMAQDKPRADHNDFDGLQLPREVTIH